MANPFAQVTLDTSTRAALDAAVQEYETSHQVLVEKRTQLRQLLEKFDKQSDELKRNVSNICSIAEGLDPVVFTPNQERVAHFADSKKKALSEIDTYAKSNLSKQVKIQTEKLEGMPSEKSVPKGFPAMVELFRLFNLTATSLEHRLSNLADKHGAEDMVNVIFLGEQEKKIKAEDLARILLENKQGFIQEAHDILGCFATLNTLSTEVADLKESIEALQKADEQLYAAKEKLEQEHQALLAQKAKEEEEKLAKAREEEAQRKALEQAKKEEEQQVRIAEQMQRMEAAAAERARLRQETAKATEVGKQPTPSKPRATAVIPDPEKEQELLVEFGRGIPYIESFVHEKAQGTKGSKKIVYQACETLIKNHSFETFRKAIIQSDITKTGVTKAIFDALPISHEINHYQQAKFTPDEKIKIKEAITEALSVPSESQLSPGRKALLAKLKAHLSEVILRTDHTAYHHDRRHEHKYLALKYAIETLQNPQNTKEAFIGQLKQWPDYAKGWGGDYSKGLEGLFSSQTQLLINETATLLAQEKPNLGLSQTGG